VVGEIFNQNLELFSAWILPLNNNGQILLPWTLNDDSMAAEMVAAWVDSVDLLYRTFEGMLYSLYVYTIATTITLKLNHLQ